jgi:hypothetical protein
VSKRLPPVVRATWFDAHSIDSWTPHKELKHESTLPLIESVGFLVLDEKDRIGLANSVDPDDDGAACCVLVIPRGMLADTPVEIAPGREIEED